MLCKRIKHGSRATISLSGVLNIDHCKVTANDGGLDSQFALEQKGLLRFVLDGRTLWVLVV